MHSTTLLQSCDRNDLQRPALKQTLVIVDSNVDQLQMLLDDVSPHSHVVVLRPDQDGISQISAALEHYDRPIDLHLVSHGSAGRLQLGNTELSFETLEQHLEQIKSWSQVLKGADLHIYGCQVAKGATGHLFLQQLHQLTGANISASSQSIGRTNLEAHWELDVQVGTPQAAFIFSQELQQNYTGHFVITVSVNTTDLVESEETPFVITFTSDDPIDPTDPPIIRFTSSEGVAGLTRFSLLGNVPSGVTINPASIFGSEFEFVEFGVTGSGANITIPTANVDDNEGRAEAFPQDVEGENETLSFSFEIIDGGANDATLAPGSDSVTVTFFEEPVPVNTPPDAVNDTATTDAGAAVGINVLANDTDADAGDVLSVNAVGDATSGTTALNDDGTVTYTPDDGFVGDDSFTYDVTDGNGGTDTATVNVTVNEVVVPNVDPDAVNDSATIDAGGVATINVLANDTDSDGGTVVVDAVGDAANGTTAITVNGNVTYTPNDGFVGDDSFTYDISDGQGGTDTATVTVTVNEVIVPNVDPDAVNDTATTDAGVAATINVLANDTDSDGGTVVVDAVGDATSGTTALNDDGTVTYTPDDGFVGDDSFTYDVSDGQGGTDTATVNVTVNEVIVPNIDPDAVNDTATTNAGEAATINVLANDTDSDGGTVVVDAVGDPTSGTTALNDDGTVTYTPDDGFVGDDSFTYDVSDGQGGTDTATVNVTVNEVVVPNVDPDAVNDTATTDAGVAATINVLANDTDSDGGTVVVDAVGDATSGTTALNDDGTVTYTPNDGFVGDDSFTYDVSDGQGGTDTATVNVTVNEVVVPNIPPDAVDDSATTDAGVAAIIDVLANDTDSDGGAVVVDAVGDATSGIAALNDDGTVTYTPNDGFVGDDSFTYDVSDGQGGTDTATVNVTVSDVIAPNGNPDAVDDSVTTDAGVAAIVNVLANDTDPDGDPITVDAVGDATSGTTALNDDGTVTYTPNDGFVGDDSFTYDVSDGNGGTDTAVVSVSVLDDGGAAPDIVGTGGRDFLRGTDGDDTIKGLGSKDLIIAKGGSDQIHGGAGSDRVFGGSGNDLIYGNRGRDVLLGQNGNDRISGGENNDTLIGGKGNDVLSGDANRDVIIGGRGNDVLMGVTGDDILIGGRGQDTFVFGNGDGTDTVFDFTTGTDFIGLVDGELAFSDLDISQNGFITTLGVTETGETLARLIGVDAENLTADQFVTVPDVSDVATLPDDFSVI
ncbi:Leukotoxin [Acaryochloris thomasi RCC1774]|uniref:Leukotoxin n=1 Tax=Acaryochloris thomasi RCC1774 TaxID=1764569 RepID=A0A2W1JMF4_9CYAN|nr:Ig-like domain-containing protein [Acaryochloris thomasi]PZD72635.1 Leukotoxin [Acaryochloris thomasi RCC1774]